MPYRHQLDQSQSDESSFTEQCSICLTVGKGFTIWMRQQHYARETSYIGKYLRTVNAIVKSKSYANASSVKAVIDYKQAILMANDEPLYEIEYKSLGRIKQEVTKTINSNLNCFRHYDKMYFGESNAKTMLQYQGRKKTYIETRYNPKSQSRQKFNIVKPTSLQSNNNLLEESTLKRNYDFYPVQMFSQHQKSKLQTSLSFICRLKKNLSIMISDHKLSEDTYPTTKNISKAYIDFTKTKEQLKFRKHLEQNISEIHQSTKTKVKPNQQYRLYTSPDPQEDREIQNKYAEAYGFLLQQNPQLRKKKKKSLLRKEFSRDKSATNLSRTKLTNCTKSSRQATEQGSHLMISAMGSSATFTSRKSKSKSKLKATSKSKLLGSATSSNKLRVMSPVVGREKSINKGKRLLGQYKG